MMTLDSTGTKECVLVVGASELKGRPISVSAGGVQVRGVATCEATEIGRLRKTYGKGLIVTYPTGTRVGTLWRGEGDWHEGGIVGGFGTQKGGAAELLRRDEPHREDAITIFLFDFAKTDHCVVIGD